MSKVQEGSLKLNGKTRPAFEPHSVAASIIKVSLIIPTLNEAENLEYLLPTIPTVDELIIVDGGSTDGTLEVVQRLRPEAVGIVDRRPGKGNALRAGFDAATGDIIVMMDADGSMNPADIPTFVATLVAGADVVKGSRFVQGGGSSDLTTLRRVGNLVLTRTVRITFGGRYSDLCYGYMAFWRHVLPSFGRCGGGFEIETLLNIRALKAGLRVVEVASYESQRLHGESHLRTFRDGSRVLAAILRERRDMRAARAAKPVRWRVQPAAVSRLSVGQRDIVEVPIEVMESEYLVQAEGR
jgi:glycosyltransferase involved in cell wall biosynthesis